jgi:hypothetical protein
VWNCLLHLAVERAFTFRRAEFLDLQTVRRRALVPRGRVVAVLALGASQNR